MLKAAIFSLSFLFTATAFAAPVPITDEDRCHTCEMWLTKHPGPKGEVVMKNGTAYKFCSVKCLSCTLLRLGYNPDIEAAYVHDAAANDWDHPGENFIDAKEAWFVVGSSKKATMGKSVAPFKTKEAAEKFQAEYGGIVARFVDFNPDMLGCKVPKKPTAPLK